MEIFKSFNNLMEISFGLNAESQSNTNWYDRTGAIGKIFGGGGPKPPGMP